MYYNVNNYSQPKYIITLIATLNDFQLGPDTSPPYILLPLHSAHRKIGTDMPVISTGILGKAPPRTPIC